MANQGDINRWKKGKDHWNEWATEMLEASKKLISFQFDLNGKAENQKTVEWLEAAAVDFSDHVFEDNTDFSNVIFPANTIFVQTIKQGTMNQGALLKTHLSFKNASLKAVRFNESNLSGADFEGAMLEEANFNGTILIQTSFQEANLKNATVKDAREFNS